MTASGNHNFFRFVAAFVFAIDNRHHPGAIDARSAFKPGDFVFLEQKINACGQPRHNIRFGLHHRCQIKFDRPNGHTHAGQMAGCRTGIMFRCMKQGL